MENKIKIEEAQGLDHWECDCVPELGPPHCHACSELTLKQVTWSEGHSGECGYCDDQGVVGSPPDGYMPCPSCSDEDLSDDRLDDRSDELSEYLHTA